MTSGSKKILRVTTVLCAVIIAFALGCNALLGNQAGILEPTDATTGALTCQGLQKECAGACVSTTDPSVGCGGACSICNAETNAASTCVLENDVETCALGACNAQYGDCDNDASDGCETHTTTTAYCGNCGTQCGSDQPYCEPSGAGGSTYKCSSVCDYTVCPDKTDAGACDDLRTDKENCGQCGVSCLVPHGTGGTCEDGGCSIHCDTGYFYCGSKCVLPTNGACGSSCMPCTGDYSCDTNVGANYGTCMPPPDAGGSTGNCTSSADCTNSVVGAICCPDPTGAGTCTAEDADHCGAGCTNCEQMDGVGSTCVDHQCRPPPLVCDARYNCSVSGLCGCTQVDFSCDTTPDFRSNATCGTCTNTCDDVNNCCCPSGKSTGDAGGYTYSCSGSPDDAGGCTCLPLPI